jgi:hypothetical protein
VLKPNRRLALAAWAGPEHNAWTALGPRELAKRGLIEPPDPDAPGQFAWAREGLIAEYLVAAGFTDHHVETIDFEIAYTSVDDWWDAHLDLSATFREAIDGAGAGVAAEVRAAAAAAAEPYTRSDGSLALPARTWVAWASL